ncbi:MAG: TIGR01458 family HAD-type hydrolase [Deltaproteobacteria bacterium]|jgi:HAD superfamily hydrolase (TIGR01458 family)|nr:TIGR01458 family HAD-type hydrolase [Deltaproteobacteria bacterium]
MNIGFLIDLSGTVYQGNELIPGADKALDLIRSKNIPVRFITNSSRTPRSAILQKLRRMGFELNDSDLFTAPKAVAEYLREHSLSPKLLVHPELRPEFDEFPSVSPNAVVICDAAHEFTYDNLNQAFRLLLDGAPLLAVGDNRYFKDNDGFSLDAGPFAKALEYAADCEAVFLGKPSPAFFHTAASGLGLSFRNIMMVGDDVLSDINGALKVGMKASLVRTGKYRSGDERRINAPGACICKNLFEAVQGFIDYVK